MTALVVRGDAATLPIADASVDLIVARTEGPAVAKSVGRERVNTRAGWLSLFPNESRPA